MQGVRYSPCPEDFKAEDERAGAEEEGVQLGDFSVKAPFRQTPVCTATTATTGAVSSSSNNGMCGDQQSPLEHGDTLSSSSASMRKPLLDLEEAEAGRGYDVTRVDEHARGGGQQMKGEERARGDGGVEGIAEGGGGDAGMVGARVMGPRRRLVGRHRSSTTTSCKGAPRLLDRSRRNAQSRGHWDVKRVGQWRFEDAVEALLYDWFNGLLMAPTIKTLIILAVAYLVIVMAFAGVYLMIAQYPECHMDLTTFTDGYMFSLETMATVGYGTQDYLFGECVAAASIVTAQIFMSIFIDAVFIGLIFLRFSRPQKRSNSIIFSRHALLRLCPHAHALTLTFRIAELCRYELVDARIRAYVIRHDRPLPPASLSAHTNARAHMRARGGGAGGLMAHMEHTNGRSLASAGAVGSSPVTTAVTSSGVPSSSVPVPQQPPQPSSSSLGPTPPQATPRSSPPPPPSSPPPPTHTLPSTPSLTTLHFRPYPLRLREPDDRLGGYLLMTLPHEIVHVLDVRSPLCPPPKWVNATGEVRQWSSALHTPTPDGDPWLSSLPHDLCEHTCRPHTQTLGTSPQRAAASGGGQPGSGCGGVDTDVYTDSTTGVMAASLSAAATAAEGGHEPLRLNEYDHGVGGEAGGDNDDFAGCVRPRHAPPHTHAHDTPPPHDTHAACVRTSDRTELEAFWTDRRVEIVCVVEGTDPLTSNSLQAKYSYTVDDILWDHAFVPCVYERPSDGGCVVRLDRFHKARPLQCGVDG